MNFIFWAAKATLHSVCTQSVYPDPALSGIENYTDVKISHRHQWVGLDGAPVTTYLTIHAPIGKKD